MLFLALHVALDHEGRGAGQPAGGIVAQQVGERPRHRFLHARRSAGGSQQGPAERRRVAGRDEPAGLDLRADPGDVLAGVEIDAEGATVAFEEHVRARGEGDEAADAHAVRRHRRGQVLERAGARARRPRRDRAPAGWLTVMASRLGTSRCRACVCGSGWISRPRTPVTRTCAFTSVLRQWLLPVAGDRQAEGRAVERDELGDEMAGRIGRDALDDAGDVDALGVVEVLERAGRKEGDGVGQGVGPAPGDPFGDDQRERIAGVGDAVDLQAIADADVGGGVDADEHPAGRILDVERAPDGIDEGHGGGHRHRVVQRGPVGPDAPDRPDRLEQAQARSATTPRAPGRARSRPVRARAGSRPRINERVVSR